MNPEHLLDQARHLLARDPKRPRQANLRRSVSASYYAIFHFLIERSTEHLVGLGPAEALRRRRRWLARAYDHSQMSECCKAFSKAQLDDTRYRAASKTIVSVGSDLRRLAKAMTDAKDRRHAADYDMNAPITRLVALQVANQVQGALSGWNTARQDPVAPLFLTGLLAHKMLRTS